MKVILSLLIINITLSYSQEISDARSNSMANSNIADINVISSSFNNPCGIIHQKKPILIFGCSSYFNLTELSRFDIAFINSIEDGDFVWGIALKRFGYSLYNENKLSIFSSKELLKWLELGLKINYFYNIISEINKTEFFLSLDIGTNIHLNQIFIFSVFLQNPFNFSRGYTHLTAMSFGVRAQTVPKLILFTEYNHFLVYKNDFKIGIEYLITDKFNFNMGVSLQRKYYGTGVGFRYKNVNFQMGFVISPILNLNTSSLLSHEFS